MSVKSFNEAIEEYRKQMAEGKVPLAYKGLMDFMLNLKNHFKAGYPILNVSGALYQGYMDLTYFAVTPDSLKSKGLKVAIVLIHETVAFEIWLAGTNKQIQINYWNQFQKMKTSFRMPPDPKVADSILEADLSIIPDFSDLDGLTNLIVKGTLDFIEKVEELIQ